MKITATNNRIKKSKQYWGVNVAMLSFLGLTLLTYIGLVQYSTASEYRLAVFKRKMDLISLDVATYQRNIDLASSPVILQTYAISHGMVPAHDNITMYPAKNVAFGN